MLGRLEIKDWPRSRGGCLKENVLEIKKRPCRFSSHSISNQASLQRWQACPSDFSSFLEDQSPQITKEPELASLGPNYPRTGPCRRTGKHEEAQPAASKGLLHGSAKLEGREEGSYCSLLSSAFLVHFSKTYPHLIITHQDFQRTPVQRFWEGWWPQEAPVFFSSLFSLSQIDAI